MGAERSQPTATLEAQPELSASPVRLAEAAPVPALSNRILAGEIQPFAQPEERPAVCAECADDKQEQDNEAGASWLTQDTKDSFLSELREAVCATADEGMAGTGNTSQACPYIEYWFAQYATRTPA